MPHSAAPPAAPSRIGTVSLVTRDLAAVSAFYRAAIGLNPISTGPDRVTLGIGDEVLLELLADKGARMGSGREPGLFHTAFLLPSREDLGAWLTHAADGGLPLQGASDHAVSEALYLLDPEGNGIEIYADRPRAAWPYADGLIAMVNARIDLQELMRAGAGRPWRGLPAGATIGHLHLQTGDLAEAEAFYAGLLGFDVTCRFPGATFYGTGGYHHQLATNSWNSRGAPPRRDGTTGLARFELVADNPALFETLMRKTAGETRLEDPSGLTLVLRPPAPAKA